MKYLILILTLAISTSWSQQADTISLEEQLKLLGETDLLVGEEKPHSRKAEKNNQSDSLTTIPAESDSTQPDLATADSTSVTDTTINEVAEADTSISEDDNAVLEEELILVEEGDTTTLTDSTATAITVESIEAINVGETQEGYKSPRRAMLLSLALPGAGQAYTKQYWRTGVYAAIEIGLIVGGIVHKRTSDELLQDAHSYHDDNFDTQRLATFLDSLHNYGLSEYNDTVSVIEGYMFNNNLEFTSDDNGQTGINKYIAHIEENRYGLAHTDPYAIQGWKEATPAYGTQYLKFYDTTKIEGIYVDTKINPLQLQGAFTPYGSASTRDTYVSMLESSDKRKEWSTMLFTSIAINHLVSAVDAYITAHRYNKKLLKGDDKEDFLPDSEETPEEKEVEVEEVDIFSRLSIENEFYPNRSGSFTTGVSISWRF